MLVEKALGTWKDGWVYGRLKQEFETLENDELEKMVHDLGFTLGWNPTLRGILENQWNEDRLMWEPQERKRKYQEQERIRLRQEQEQIRQHQEQEQIRNEQIRQAAAKKKAMEVELINRELEEFKTKLIEAGDDWNADFPWFESSSDLFQDVISELNQFKVDLKKMCQWSKSQALEASRRFSIADNVEAKAFHAAQKIAYTRFSEELDPYVSRVEAKLRSVSSRVKNIQDLLDKR
ncbi:hypothetical protein K9N68_14745 [Kovacikia minuta CCNUW1]|uniref:hypothetical protein n=1 Tax=Kovacikia minuta TaxID=2931930 RepID=UPI001CCCA422|nr:hypothetical protein [Kovacikia minuta]UBF28981.1 hypothetical protein K9N68_14745 [Kovacikia minuta CCNUW1]